MGIITEILKGLPMSAVLEDKLKNLEAKYEATESENAKLRASISAFRQDNEELKKQLKQRSHEQAARATYSEDDLLGILESWFKSLPHERMFAVIEYSDVDPELNLPEGTAKRYLKRSVAGLAINGAPIEVKRDGDSTILFHRGRRQLRRTLVKTF